MHGGWLDQMKVRVPNTIAMQTTVFAWETSWRVISMMLLGMFLTAYDLTGESKYLDMFAQSFDNMRSALTRGPDGYLGWYGKALSTFQDPDNPDRKVDVIITSFRITDLVSRFREAAAKAVTKARNR